MILPNKKITGSIPAAAAAAAIAGFVMALRAVGAAAAAATAAAHAGFRIVNGVPGFNPAEPAAAKIGFKIGFSAAEPNRINGFNSNGTWPGPADYQLKLNKFIHMIVNAKVYWNFVK